MTMTTDIDTAVTVAEESTALALAEQQLEKLLAEDPNVLDMWGGENLEEGDTGQPPRLKLCQPSTPDTTAEPGQFFNTLTGETFAAVEVVPLLPLSATRAEFFRPYKKGEPPYCASDDGKMPRQSTERQPLQNPKPGPCAECPSAKWNRDDRNKPDCTRQRNFMVMIRNSGEMAQVTWQKTSTPTARRATALMKSAGIRKSIIFTSKFVDGDSGKYFEPLVTAGGRLPADELLRAIEMRGEVDRLVKSGAITISAEEEADYTNGNGGGNGSTEPPATDLDADSIPF